MKDSVKFISLYSLQHNEVCIKALTCSFFLMLIYFRFTCIYIFENDYWGWRARSPRLIILLQQQFCFKHQLVEQFFWGGSWSERNNIQWRFKDLGANCSFLGACPLLHHHYLGLHWQPPCGFCSPPYQEHEEHNKSFNPQPGGMKNFLVS